MKRIVYSVFLIICAGIISSCSKEDLSAFGYLPGYGALYCVCSDVYIDGIKEESLSTTPRHVGPYDAYTIVDAFEELTSQWTNILTEMSYNGNGQYTASLYNIPDGISKEYSATFDGTTVTVSNGQTIEFKIEDTEWGQMYVVEKEFQGYYRYGALFGGGWGLIRDDTERSFRFVLRYAVPDQLNL